MLVSTMKVGLVVFWRLWFAELFVFYVLSPLRCAMLCTSGLCDTGTDNEYQVAELSPRSCISIRASAVRLI